MNIRTFQSGDDRVQALLFNAVAFSLPGFKPATVDDVKKRTRARGFDPSCRFYAQENGEVVGYCVLEPEQSRVSYPWCRKGFESAAPLLFESVIRTARSRGLAKVFAAYRRDWDSVLGFFANSGFVKAREMVNFAAEATDLPTVASRAGLPIRRLERSDIPALAQMGKGLIRLPEESLEQYYFANPYYPVEAFLVLDGRDGTGPVAVGVGLEASTWADVRKVDPLAPCFRMGAFGTEGLNTKRVNGLFSYVVARPEDAIPAGLGLLAAASEEMTEGTVSAIAAQCPTDAPHLLQFYRRYFKEQGRFPVYERDLSATKEPAPLT